jgi:hypothetical protein
MASLTNNALRARSRSPISAFVADNRRQPGISPLDSPGAHKNPKPVEKIMPKQCYVDRSKLSPARTFKSPMDVVEANDIKPAEKLAILEGWAADERALLRAEDEGMGGGEHAHLHKVQAALNQLGGSLAKPS